MAIKLEIHAPGLDLHHERWTYHVLFMDSMHKHAERVSACAWRTYQKQGRGALFIPHHPGAQLSSYLMGPDLSPPEVAEKFQHLADSSTA